jgi:hypothetical protein
LDVDCLLDNRLLNDDNGRSGVIAVAVGEPRVPAAVAASMSAAPVVAVMTPSPTVIAPAAVPRMEEVVVSVVIVVVVVSVVVVMVPAPEAESMLIGAALG